jgi:hypothetical protein
LQNLDLSSALGAFEEEEGIFIVPNLLWHGTSAFPIRRIAPLSRLLRHNILTDGHTIL